MTDHVQPGAFNVRCRRALAYVALAGLVLLLMNPVLTDGQFHMLDSAGIYSGCATASIFRPGSLICLMGISNQARPGQFLMYLPAFVARSARLHYWFQSGLVLYLTLAGFMFLVHRVTGRRALAFAGAAACLFTASFVENFFTLFKAEIFMQFGAVCIMCALWLVLFDSAEFRGRTWLIRVLGVGGAIYALTVKETAGTFLMVLIVGVPLLLCARSEGMWLGIRRVAWLMGFAVAAFAVLLLRFLTLPSRYTQGGTASYSLAPQQLIEGIVTLWAYLGATTPYVMPALIGTALGIVLIVRRCRPLQAAQRTAIAWTLFAWLWFGGSIAVYVPWSGFQVRYMVVANTAALMATALSVHLALDAARHAAGSALRVVLWALVALTGTLVVLHSAFSLCVGPLSEARIRCGVDTVDAAMNAWVARAMPKGGTVYFLMDTNQPEPVMEMQMRMGIFQNRPDLKCKFPLTASEVIREGLVCVPSASYCYNPNRIPVHGEAARRFKTSFAGQLSLTLVTNFSCAHRVWFTDPYALRGCQYKARVGVPAFWQLKRGEYHFGWDIYRHTAPPSVSLLHNGDFEAGMEEWQPWCGAVAEPALVTMGTGCVRIKCPRDVLAGVKQHVGTTVRSGQVFRLSASARTVGRIDSGKIMGARIMFFLPPQPEYSTAWLSQRGAWTPQEIVFTNQVEGKPVIVLHMGYGTSAGEAEFADVRLEPLSPSPP